MICPKCMGQTKVLDSRENKDGTKVTRRRECLSCGYRYTTVEQIKGGQEAK